MILSTIRMAIPHAKRGEVLRILRSLAEQIRDDVGCLGCHIYEDINEKNMLIFEEVWRADEDMNYHIRSDKYRNLLLVLEMADKQPEIRFNKITQTTGIETIEKIRNPI